MPKEVAQVTQCVFAFVYNINKNNLCLLFRETGAAVQFVSLSRYCSSPAPKLTVLPGCNNDSEKENVEPVSIPAPRKQRAGKKRALLVPAAQCTDGLSFFIFFRIAFS